MKVGSTTIEQLDMARHEHLAEQAVALQNAENPQMLPFSMDGFYEYPLGAIAHQNNTQFVGCNAVIQEYEAETLEIGALYIHPEFRGRGLTWPIKAELMKYAQIHYLGWTAITFVNQTSEPINRKLGFTDAATIPEAALALCQGCEKQCQLPPETLCCDKILSMEIRRGE